MTNESAIVIQHIWNYCNILSADAYVWARRRLALTTQARNHRLFPEHWGGF